MEKVFMCYSCRSKKFFVVAKIFDKHGRVLSIGWNSYRKTDPQFNLFAKRMKRPEKEFIHAEMRAFKRLKITDYDRAYSIKVYRFYENGSPALAEPCPICWSIIKFHGIKHVEYTTYDDSLDMTFEEYDALRKAASDWIF